MRSSPAGRRPGARPSWPGGRSSGPLDLEAQITEFNPLQRLGFTLDGPSLEVSAEPIVDSPGSGRARRSLDYRGHIDVRHRMASRMRGLFNEIAEDHAHSLIQRVKVKAEQRRLAQERLLK